MKPHGTLRDSRPTVWNGHGLLYIAMKCYEMAKTPYETAMNCSGMVIRGLRMHQVGVGSFGWIVKSTAWASMVQRGSVGGMGHQ